MIGKTQNWVGLRLGLFFNCWLISLIFTKYFVQYCRCSISCKGKADLVSVIFYISLVFPDGILSFVYFGGNCYVIYNFIFGERSKQYNLNRRNSISRKISVLYIYRDILSAWRNLLRKCQQFTFIAFLSVSNTNV